MTTDKFGHETTMSDSSLYDEKCTKCGATDAMGDGSLDKQCPASGNAAIGSFSPEFTGCATIPAKRHYCLADIYLHIIRLEDREPDKCQEVLKITNKLNTILNGE